jgi:hypothetical protein
MQYAILDLGLNWKNFTAKHFLLNSDSHPDLLAGEKIEFYVLSIGRFAG